MNRRGLTLVELLVAMVILGVSLAALTSLWSFGFNVTQSSQDTAVAYSIARREIERVRNIGFSSIPPQWERTQGYDFVPSSGTWEETDSARPHFLATTAMDPYVTDPNMVTEGSLRTVRVRVRQREGNRLAVETESHLTRGGI